MRAEGDKLAQEAAAAVKAETDKLAKKYDTMDTDVKSVKSDLTKVMSSTTQLEQDMIVSTLIEYAVGDSDTVPPDLATYWTGEPNNSVSVLSDPWGPTTPERTPGTYIWMRTRVTFGDGGQETSAPVLVTGNTGAQGPQGVPGEPGADGLPGAAGTNGKTSYLHLAYANSSDGRTDFSTSDSNRDYIGQYTDFTQQDSTDPTRYAWSKIKGAQGAQGLKGDPGATGPDSNRDYIGQYTDFTQQDSTDPTRYAWSKIKGAQGAQGLKGDPGATGLPGAPGADGRTSYAHFAYANSADGRTDFSTTNGVGKKYLGQYVDFVESDSTDPTKYAWSLIVGPQGPQGVAGPKGDKGEDVGKKYLGQYVDFVESDSTDPTKYAWSLIVGPQGPQGVAGPKGDKGEDGITRYSGQYVDFVESDSTDPTKYAWSLIVGPQGPQGVAGPKGDKGEDGITRYSYFAYGTSSSGANFSKTPTAASTYIGVCVTTAATQPTDPKQYTWSLTKGNTGAQGPQGAAGAKGDVGEDGKTYYTYFAYATSVSGANFSKTPTSSSTYMGVCITLDTTQPTDPSKYTWSLTKGAQGATGAQGVSVSALTPFWQLAESKPAQPVNKSPGGGWSSTEPAYVRGKKLWTCSRIDYSNGQWSWTLAESKPAQPVNKSPGGGWSSTEPAYVRGKKLWTCSRIDYSNGQWSWTSVQQSSAFEAADLALTTANGKNRRFVQATTPTVPAAELTQGDEWWQTSSKPPETYWTGKPNNSVSVLVDHSGEVEHIWVWNGTRWALNRLSAEDIIVSGSVAAGLVTADFFDGARIRGGEFVTSNELIRLNNAGLVMNGKSGERLVTLNATDGTATFNSVAITNGALSAGTIDSAAINGGSFTLRDKDGRAIGHLNSSGMDLGDVFAFAKQNGEWLLSIKGSISAGSTISGASIVGDSTVTGGVVQTSAEDRRGIKLTGGNLDIYRSDKTRFMRANEEHRRRQHRDRWRGADKRRRQAWHQTHGRQLGHLPFGQDAVHASQRERFVHFRRQQERTLVRARAAHILAGRAEQFGLRVVRWVAAHVGRCDPVRW